MYRLQWELLNIILEKALNIKTRIEYLTSTGYSCNNLSLFFKTSFKLYQNFPIKFPSEIFHSPVETNEPQPS